MKTLVFEDMATARWDHVVAAASGEGWTKQMLARIDGASLRWVVWFGSCCVVDTPDLAEAVFSYNTADIIAAQRESDVVDD